MHMKCVCVCMCIILCDKHKHVFVYVCVCVLTRNVLCFVATALIVYIQCDSSSSSPYFSSSIIIPNLDCSTFFEYIPRYF